MFTSNRRRTRGAASSLVIISIVILLALALAGWFLVIKPNRDATRADTPVAPSAAKKKVTKSAPPPANVAAMSTDQLLSEASKALKDQRLLAPEGNNAFEFYLKVLERQPNNQVAKDALRETFPFGANAAEHDINDRNFAAAQRDIDLLAKADPDNYTLTILRSKLDAQRKTASKEQQEAQDKLLAQQQRARDEAAAAEKAAAEKAAADKAAAEKAKAEQTQVAGQQQNTPEQNKAPEAQGKPAPKKVKIQNAVAIRTPGARYPSSAIRRRLEGWVDVQFTVDTDGSVSNVKAVDAKPHHVFERAATNAVGRWKFRPALNNGKPFPVTMRKRIKFNLGNN